MYTNQQNIPPNIALLLSTFKNLNLNLITFSVLIYAIAVKFSEGQLHFVTKNALVIALLVFVVTTLNDFLKPASLLANNKITFLNQHKTVLFRALVIAILAMGGLLIYIPHQPKIWIIGFAFLSGAYLYIFNKLLAKSQFEWLRRIVQSLLLVVGIWGIVWLGQTKTNISFGGCFIMIALFAQNAILQRYAMTKNRNDIQKKNSNIWPTKTVLILMTAVIIIGITICYHLENRFLIRLVVIFMVMSIVQTLAVTRLKQLQRYQLFYFIINWILIFPAVIF